MKHKQSNLFSRIIHSSFVSFILFLLIIHPIKAAPTYGVDSSQAGTVWSWGFNYHGQLGNGESSYESQVFPAKILNLSRIIDIRGGSGFSMALDMDGYAWSWGDNTFGELGDGTHIDRYYPNLVVELSNDQMSKYPMSDISKVSAGSQHSLALKKDGTVWSWGYNGLGNLGNGSTTDSVYPKKIPGLNDVIDIEARGDHNLAIKADGKVWAWGSNSFGEIGDGSSVTRFSPTLVEGIEDIIAISCGASHSLALKSDGSVWAWGRNSWGQLGDGTTINRYIPVQVGNLSNVTFLAAGGIHSLALKGDGSVWAWGNNFNGQLGISNVAGETYTSPNSTSEDSTELNAGFNSTSGSGYINVPVKVDGLSQINSIAGGDYHSLALGSNGIIWAWGYNGYGELGDGTTITRTTPTVISSINQGVAISAGSYSSFAIVTGTRPLWDVNGDHVCNVGDLILVGSHWNEEGAPGWILEDVNSDGIISVGDLILIGSHWNETW